MEHLHLFTYLTTYRDQICEEPVKKGQRIQISKSQVDLCLVAEKNIFVWWNRSKFDLDALQDVLLYEFMYMELKWKFSVAPLSAETSLVTIRLVVAEK